MVNTRWFVWQIRLFMFVWGYYTHSLWRSNCFSTILTNRFRFSSELVFLWIVMPLKTVLLLIKWKRISLFNDDFCLLVWLNLLNGDSRIFKEAFRCYHFFVLFFLISIWNAERIYSRLLTCQIKFIEWWQQRLIRFDLSTGCLIGLVEASEGVLHGVYFFWACTFLSPWILIDHSI